MALFMSNNIVHASDGEESARRELEIFFEPEEIIDYGQTISGWIGITITYGIITSYFLYKN